MPGGISYIGDLSVVETGGEITSASVGDKALKSTCSDNVSLEVDSSTGKMQIKSAGSSLANGVQRGQMSKYAGYWFRGALTAAAGAGAVFSLENTYGSNLVVTRAIIYLTALTGHTCTIDVGVGASGSGSYDTLIDGLNVNSATGAYGNIKNKGTNGEESELWGTGKHLTASLSAEPGSIAGFYAVHVIDLNS